MVEQQYGFPQRLCVDGTQFRTCVSGTSPADKGALGIAGVGTAISSWRSKADSDKKMPGFQIDMIIERADRIIHLCEMKSALTVMPSLIITR